MAELPESINAHDVAELWGPSELTGHLPNAFFRCGACELRNDKPLGGPFPSLVDELYRVHLQMESWSDPSWSTS
jgi:hypothetical protein